MSHISVTVPEEALVALKLAPEAAGATLRLAAAIKFYELGRLSSGAAASLAGVPRTVYLSRLAEYGVATFTSSQEELVADLANA
jgi:predicted HTH domain antitoxin